MKNKTMRLLLCKGRFFMSYIISKYAVMETIMAFIIIIIVIVLLMSKAKRISNDHIQIWNQGLNAIATVTDKEYTKKDILLWVRYVGNDRNEHTGSIHVLDESIGIGSTVPVKYLPSDYEHTISLIERWFVEKEDPNPYILNQSDRKGRFLDCQNLYYKKLKTIKRGIFSWKQKMAQKQESRQK